ncbi:MAG: hypothetical protein MUF48_18490, partial [Pirellulaceae bacterium]|nr:hypothetical protein [Pirellulaceae bacterium]
ARCQHMLRQGHFVADFAFLQDEAIPGFIPPRPDQRPLGFDYDVLNAEVLLTRVSARAGRLELPCGMSYRYLVLPQRPDAVFSAVTLKKVDELAEAGVAVIGPKTLAASITKLREGSWDVVTRADGLRADVEFRSSSPSAQLDWIHRRDGATEIYFVSNQSVERVETEAVFRVAGKQPELWDAVTGSIRDLQDFHDDHGHTVVPLQFAPRQSWFVVFRRPMGERAAQRPVANFPGLRPVQEVAGPWNVSFDPRWFYPDGGTGGRVRFDTLDDWSQRPEEGIRYYSGTATYRTTFECHLEDGPSAVYLDLGAVHNVARIRLNDHDLGVVWTAPWRVEITGAIRRGVNELEIEVANLWPNRLIGDATLPPDERRTVTNVRTYDTMASGTYGCQKCEQRKSTGKPAELLPAGLLGPVTLQRIRRDER